MEGWAPTTCPMADPAAVGACRNVGAACDGCVWEADARAPTGYLPHGRTLHPVVQAVKDARTAARKAAKRSDAARRNRANRARGRRFETKVARETGGERVPGSGAFGGDLSGDVRRTTLFPSTWRIEAKSRQKVALYKFFEQGEQKPDVVAIASPHKPTLYVMDKAHVERLAGLGGATVDAEKVAAARQLLEEALDE